MNGDLWAAAIEELQLALSFEEENPLANKYMAQAYMKSHHIEEALPYFRKYADKENSTDSLNELAHAYTKLGLYKEAEEIFAKMKEKLLKAYVMDTLAVRDKKAKPPGKAAIISFYKKAAEQKPFKLWSAGDNHNSAGDGKEMSSFRSVDKAGKTIHKSVLKK